MNVSPGRLSFVIALPLVAVLPSSAVQGSNDPDKIYTRVLDRALDSAQKKIEATTEVWEDHSTWDKAWEIPSKHFVVKTTQAFTYGQKLGVALDTMVGRMQKLVAPDYRWTGRAQVLLYPDIAAYNAHSNNTNADEHSSIYGSYFSGAEATKPVVAAFNPNGTLVWIEVTHSVTHQFLERAYPGRTRPAWVEEGLASYFALQWDLKWAASEMARFQEQSSWVPVFNLLRRPISRYGNRANQYILELGMLFNYLLHYRPDTKSTVDAKGVQQGPFADYLRQLLAGKNINSHPVHKVLFTETKTLEDGLKANKW